MSVNVSIQYMNEETQNPIIGLPITRKYCWANNKLGYGSGCNTQIYKTDGNGKISFLLPNLNPIETSGASSIELTSPKVNATAYQTGYYSTDTTINVGSWDNNQSLNRTILVPQIVYSSITSSSTSTVTQNTSYTSTTTSGQINNILDSLGKYGIWIMIALVILAISFVAFFIMKNGRPSFSVGSA